MNWDDSLDNWWYRCPGCGLEPEVENYLRTKDTHERVGYVCRCGAQVVDGVVQFFHRPEGGKSVIYPDQELNTKTINQLAAERGDQV